MDGMWAVSGREASGVTTRDVPGARSRAEVPLTEMETLRRKAVSRTSGLRFEMPFQSHGTGRDHRGSYVQAENK